MRHSNPLPLGTASLGFLLVCLLGKLTKGEWYELATPTSVPTTEASLEATTNTHNLPPILPIPESPHPWLAPPLSQVAYLLV